EDKQDRDQITFTSLAHYPSVENSRESDQAEISYRVQDNPNLPGTLILQRKEVPYFWNAKREDANAGFVDLADNLISFNLEYDDGEKYVPAWDIAAQETLNKLPKLVRVTFTVQDEDGRQQTFQTITDLPMSESIGIVVSPTPAGSPVPGSNQRRIPGP
ncbi:MAG: hypothetical protein KDD48_07815, partial [Bdellovibrionales bacterium]|nr:hypothetical protein [Bdellovibrionales bacterium]